MALERLKPEELDLTGVLNPSLAAKLSHTSRTYQASADPYQTGHDEFTASGHVGRNAKPAEQDH